MLNNRVYYINKHSAHTWRWNYKTVQRFGYFHQWTNTASPFWEPTINKAIHELAHPSEQYN